jgi:predicted tellurium resistance membrane protein TerC
MYEWMTTAEGWTSLTTITAMEIVLGVDNVIFLSILTGKLPPAERPSARRWGLLAAAVSRLGLLLGVAWIASLTEPLVHIAGHALSGKMLVLLAGGLFLIFKATREIHHKLEGEASEVHHVQAAPSFRSIMLQVMVLDMVFALDSVITSVGMTDHVSIMVAANLIALGVMLWFADPIADFIERHPAVKVLALAFLLLIGTTLVAEGVGFHVPKGYVYFAMAFSVGVELLHIRTAGRVAKVS